MIISFLRGDKRVDSSTNSAFYVMAQNVYFWNDWRQLLDLQLNRLFIH